MPSSQVKSKTHILHLLATEYVGGPEKQVLSHLRYVDRDRFHMIVGSYLEGGRSNPFLSAAQDLGAETLALHQHFPCDPRLILDLRRALVSRRVDALVTHGYKSNVVGHLASKGIVPQAMYVRGWTQESFRVKLYHWLEKRFLPKASLLVTVAEGKRGEIAALGIPESKIRVITNSVETSPPEPANRSLRQRFNIPPDHVVLVAAGRLSPEKGHRVLLEALSQLGEAGRRVSCVIFGEGPLRASLLRQIADLGLDDRVALAGFHPSWKRHLPEADALVNPSLSEVMPNVVLEGMAQRCPIIATRVGGVPELVPNDSLGLVVEPGNPEALAQAIGRLMCGELDVDAIRRQAYEHVARMFTFEAQAVKLHALYDELTRAVRA